MLNYSAEVNKREVEVVVLMGAGASFGSEIDKTKVPPLGGQLFEALRQRGGIAASLPAYAREAFKDGFEGGMEAVRRSGIDDMGFTVELAHFIAEFTPSSDNVYISLIAALPKNKVVYASLNYDLMFELSTSFIGVGVKYEVKASIGTVRLLKPHGSCNFWPHTGNNVFKNIGMIGCGIHVHGLPITVLSQQETLYRCRERLGFAPAIAEYAKDKAVRVGNDYVYRQQDILASCIHCARHVFIIGVRVNIEDKHIWQPLANTCAELTYFAHSEEDENDFELWRSSTRTASANALRRNFPEAVREIVRRF